LITTDNSYDSVSASDGELFGTTKYFNVLVNQGYDWTPETLERHSIDTIVRQIEFDVRQKVLSGISGIWTGIGYQKNNGSRWTIKMTIDSLNSKYLIEYPSLNCGGVLSATNIPSLQDPVLVFSEKITFGNDRCVDGGKITVIPSGNLMKWDWYGPNGGLDATSELSFSNLR